MDEAMRRFAALRPHLEEGVSLTTAARAADVPIRTAQRWLSRYRLEGLDGLKVRARSDRGTRKLPGPLITLIEGLALRKPRLSCAAIYRRAETVAKSRDWSVCQSARNIDPLSASKNDPLTERTDSWPDAV